MLTSDGSAGQPADPNFDRAKYDAIGESDEAGLACRIGAAHSVVSHRDAQVAVDDLRLDLDQRRVGVLGRVRQRLRDDVVGRGLDWFR